MPAFRNTIYFEKILVNMQFLRYSTRFHKQTNKFRTDKWSPKDYHTQNETFFWCRIYVIAVDHDSPLETQTPNNLMVIHKRSADVLSHDLSAAKIQSSENIFKYY